MTESEKDITAATRDLARRMNIYTIWRVVSVFVLWGIGIVVVLISISKFVVISIPLTLAVASILGVSLVAGIIRGILACVSALEAAMTADAQLGLKERLSSAVELLGEKGRSEMAELQLEDAAEHARSLDPKAICPRVFPKTAKVLPLAGLVLILLIYAPSRYGQPAEVPLEVRRAMEQAGAEMETTATEVDKDLLSDQVADMASKVALTGRELQDRPLTKKDALKNLSNLAREIEAMKMMGKIAEELKGEMTPEKKRILNELLEMLADNLKDLRGMEELAERIMKAQQTELSMEALKELSAALEKINIKASDMKALQQMTEQVAKGRRDIGQVDLAAARGVSPTGTKQDEQGSGRMGGLAPGNVPAKDMEETAVYASQRIPSSEGYDSELESRVSEKGRGITTEIKADLEKSESLVPYEDIYVKYRDAADDAITRTKIPWMYREHVKNYFDAIRPKGDQKSVISDE